MQAIDEDDQPQQKQHQRLRDVKVKDLTAEKRRLVEVPYTASLAHTMNVLAANKVVAVPVAAPPGHWIGAGGSMILESDKMTGAVRKHYIGMLTMLDILAHIAGGDDDEKMNGADGVSDLDKKMSVSVSTVIGHCIESLSLWTLNPTTSILDCMEVLSKGIHRALVPVESKMNVAGVELVESASSYQMLTQMDLLRFLINNYSHQLQPIISNSIKQLGALNETVFAITDRTKLVHAIKCMKAALLNAVPIVKASDSQEDPKQFINGKGRELVGTFSATDLRGCHFASLQTWLPLTALDYTENVTTTPLLVSPPNTTRPRQLVTCNVDSSLSEAITKAVTEHVHRVWVVNDGLLVGVVSLTDMIRVVRTLLLSNPQVMEV